MSWLRTISKSLLVVVALIFVSALVIPLSSGGAPTRAVPLAAVSGCSAGADAPGRSGSNVTGSGGFRCNNGGTSSVQVCLFHSSNYGLTYTWWSCKSATYTDSNYHQLSISVASVSGSAARYWLTRFYLSNSKAGQSGYWYSSSVQNYRKPA